MAHEVTANADGDWFEPGTFNPAHGTEVEPGITNVNGIDGADLLRFRWGNDSGQISMNPHAVPSDPDAPGQPVWISWVTNVVVFHDGSSWWWVLEATHRVSGAFRMWDGTEWLEHSGGDPISPAETVTDAAITWAALTIVTDVSGDWPPCPPLAARFPYSAPAPSIGERERITRRSLRPHAVGAASPVAVPRETGSVGIPT